MRYLKSKLIKALVAHFVDDDRRIDHALRVTMWAERILETEPGDAEVVLASAVLHDVGIKEAEARDGESTGKLQEKYGPAIARDLLARIGFPSGKIEEVCAIIGNHHTPSGVDSPSFSILWDADLLVNIPDDCPDLDPQKLRKIIDRSFRTPTGRSLAGTSFLGDRPGMPSR